MLIGTKKIHLDAGTFGFIQKSKWPTADSPLLFSLQTVFLNFADCVFQAYPAT